MPDTNQNETLPAKFEDWTPPWGDKPEEFDADRAARRIFGLLQDKQKATSDKAAALAAKTEAEKQRDTLQAQIDAKAREGESEQDRLKRENADLQAKLEKESGTSQETLKLRVALDKGLTLDLAQRLIGSTEEELSADADKLLTQVSGETGSGGGGEGDGPKRIPKRTQNPMSPDSDDPKPYDGPAEKVVDEFIPRTSF